MHIAKAGILKTLTITTALFWAMKSWGQTTGTSQLNTLLTADSLVSGNAKDVLTSFFRLSLDHLIGDDKQLNFASNPFAIMLKSDPSLAMDRNYYKYRVLRKINFVFGLKLDSAYRFNGFSSGITYALINKRDSSTSALLFDSLRNNELAKEVDSLSIELNNYTNTIQDINEKKRFHKMMHAFFETDIPFNKLDTTFRLAVKKIINAHSGYYKQIAEMSTGLSPYSIREQENKMYNRLKEGIKNDLLWTAGISDTAYTSQFFFSNIVFNTELVKGISKPGPGSNIEFDVRSYLNLRDDTLTKRRDLQRAFFCIDPGFNYVLRNRNNDQSILECKLSGSYYHHLGSLYKNELRDSLTLNATLRIRVIGDVWIPLEIKYDPASGAVYGYLDVRANFYALGHLLKPGK
ncbi:MAG TPA: hypothetical protein VG847_07030 [Chitinophagaceae bacterium]|nr:hypothetical protein [Chitinophagaceae bacterium]